MTGASTSDRLNRSALEFRADLDQVVYAEHRCAMTPSPPSAKRPAGGRPATEWARLEKSSFLTDAEKRLAVGYAAEPDLPASKFNPAQPRAENGQWTSDGGSGVIATTTPQVALGPLIGSGGQFGPFSSTDITLVAENPAAQINILDEDALGGHTYERHVGKSDLYLLNRVKTETFSVLGVEVSLRRAGTYPSLEAANKLTNSTLSDPANSSVIASVANGAKSRDFVTKVFGRQTGVEAFAPRVRSTPYMRDTFAVEVRIVHDASQQRGYRVISSYPRNMD